MITFLFPGQGSQKRGMGQGLFDDREYVAIERRVDEFLGYSMRTLCLDDPQKQLNDTRFTQPALYIVNALYYYKALREGMRPAFLAGHSLGEYNALLAAGVFDFFTGIQLVTKRGEIMGRAKNGGMGAVIGLGERAIRAVINQNGLSSIDVANFNSPSQTVVSGPIVDIKRAGPIFEAAGARMFMPLQVSAAFHSRYMAEAAAEFASFLGTVKFAPPTMTVISNVTAEPYPKDSSSENTRSSLCKQMVQSVLWTQTIEYLQKQGVRDFKEIGPGNVLTRFVQQIVENKG